MLSRFVAFTSLGCKALPNQWDIAALAIVLAIFVAIAQGSHGLTAPLPPAESAPMELDYWQLPYYGLRTTLRMFAAIAASLVFTLTYATLAAKSRRPDLFAAPSRDKNVPRGYAIVTQCRRVIHSRANVSINAKHRRSQADEDLSCPCAGK